MVAAKGSGAAAGAAATGTGAMSVRGSAKSWSTIIRLMKFSSSRMLPGQLYWMKAAIASAGTSRSGKLNSRE